MGCYRRGSVLILVLFVMTVLSLVALSFAYRAGLESRSARDSAIMTQLRAHAAAAAAIAIGRLKENTNDFDHRAEPWHAHAPLADEDWLTEWTQGQAGEPPAFVTEYQVIDEEAKLNVLFASSEALESLGASQEQIASLFDWMDADAIARAEGAENEYYLARPQPYRAKNAPIAVLNELLMIRGFSRADYLGEDANHNRRLDPSENDGGITYPTDNADGRLQPGWVDLLTCVEYGRINLNTASRAVLATLPLSRGAADQIVGFRAFDENSSGNLEEHVFRTAADVRQLQGITEADGDVLALVTTFKSTHFRIFVRSRHTRTELRYHLQVLVRTDGDKLEILQWKAEL